jgi:hypothetical protein
LTVPDGTCNTVPVGTRTVPDGEAAKMEARVRFNRGYHDAALQFSLGKPRKVVLQGPASPTVCSFEYDSAYAAGYLAGLAHSAWGMYAGNSDSAWNDHLTSKYSQVVLDIVNEDVAKALR